MKNGYKKTKKVKKVTKKVKKVTKKVKKVTKKVKNNTIINNEKYKLIKVRTFIEDDNKLKIKGYKAKQLFPSIVKWYKKTLDYLPFIKVEAINYPYIKITLLNEDFEYIGKTSIADPDQDGNYPLFYKKKRYWVYGEPIKFLN